MVDGPQFFDDDEIFERYQKGRKRPDNPNDSLEKPVMLELIGNVKYADVLDLGCGDGDLGNMLLAMGCKSYLGVEASSRMVTLAQKNLSSDKAKIVQAYIQDYHFPKDCFHLVVSRLALHYVEHLDVLFSDLCLSLQKGGRFVFSVEHPIMTSHNASLEQSGGKRLDWLVDNYFQSGKRHVKWMGKEVTKYHRTLEEYVCLLQSAGFTILSIRESKPKRENFVSQEEFERRHRIPLFLFFSVQAQYN